MRIIGNRNLYRSDILDIVTGQDKISLDNCIVEQFNEESTALPTNELASLIQELNSSKAGQLSGFLRDGCVISQKAFLFFTLLEVVRNKKSLRLEVAESLVETLNASKNLKELKLISEPYNILLSILPNISESELTCLKPAIPTLLKLAMTMSVYTALRSRQFLSIASFSLSIEGAAIKPDFLSLAMEKKALQRNFAGIADDINSMTIGSKRQKFKSNIILQDQLEQLGMLRTSTNQLFELVTEASRLTESETVKNYKFVEKEKTWTSIKVLVTQIYNLILTLTTTTLTKLKNSQQIPNLELEIIRILENSQKIQLPTSTQCSAISTEFEDFSVFRLWDDLVLIWKDVLVLEGWHAFEILKEAQAMADANKGKKEFEFALGKGSHVIFNRLIDATKTLESPNSLSTFATKFSVFPDLVSLIADLVSSKNEVGRKPKIPKGTRDYAPNQMAIRAKAMDIITKVFHRHGAVEIDTPVFELKETLMGKYGEDSKLIYDLEDQGGEQLSLRYDLTVPFARYLAMKNIASIKRYHIAKVYRRDNPVMSKGRFREFYQCDFDIAGNYDSMIPDAEVLKVIDEILTELDIGNFCIKINNRKILDALVEISGAPKEKFKQICSSIDKLDKETWETVERELVNDKGLTCAMTTVLYEYVSIKGNPIEVCEKLKKTKLAECALGKEALEEMSLVFTYLDAMNCLSNISFDMSLARGLDYYTGLILEAVLVGGQVGSIAGGGRYDQLVGMFSNKPIPAIGASIGIERIFVLLEEKLKNDCSMRTSKTEFLVATIGGGMLQYKMKIASELWAQKVKAEILYLEKPKPQKQLSYALDNLIPFVIWLGEDEIANGVVKIKCMYLGTEHIIKREDLLSTVHGLSKQYESDLAEGKVIYSKEK